MAFTQPYHKLIVWQKADEFAKAVYKDTMTFPSDEKYGVISQLRRAALSIPLNIVEGQARGSSKDFSRFLIQARASCSECAYLLEFSRDQTYLSLEKFERLELLRRRVNYLLQQTLIGLR